MTTKDVRGGVERGIVEIPNYHLVHGLKQQQQQQPIVMITSRMEPMIRE